MNELDRLLERAALLRARVSNARSSLERTTRDLANARADEDLAFRSSEVLRQLLDQELVEGVRILQDLLQEALRAVFPEQELSVRVDTEVARGKVEVGFSLSQRKGDGSLFEGDALDGFGGAVSTVISIVLRAYLILKRGLAPILVLDESLPAFDRDRVRLMGAFLRGLSERTGVDILLVTHETEFEDVAHRVYSVRELPDGTSGVVSG